MEDIETERTWKINSVTTITQLLKHGIDGSTMKPKLTTLRKISATQPIRIEIGYHAFVLQVYALNAWTRVRGVPVGEANCCKMWYWATTEMYCDKEDALLRHLTER